MGTGKENGSQKWLPEKNWYLKNGYQKRICISNMVTRKELVSQLLLQKQLFFFFVLIFQYIKTNLYCYTKYNKYCIFRGAINSKG